MMSTKFQLSIVLTLILSSNFIFAKDETKISEKPEKLSASHAREFFQNPNYSSAKVDPSGKRVSFIEHQKNIDKLMLLDLNSNNMQVVYIDNDDRLRDYHWIDDDTIVVSVRYKDFGRSLYKFDFVYAGGKLIDVKEKLILHQAYLLDALPSLKDKIAVAYFSEDKPDIYRFDLSRKNISSQLGGRHKLNKNAPEADNWIFDSTGDLKVMESTDGNEVVVWYKEPKKGRWVEVWREHESTTFKPVSFNSENEELLVLSNHQRNYVELLRFKLNGKSFGETVFKVDNQDIDDVALNQNRDGVLYASYIVNGVEQRKYFTGLGDFIKQQLNKNLKASGFWVHDKSLDNSVVLALKRNSKQPGIYYLFETASSQLSLLTETRPWLGKFKLGNDKLINSSSSDGLKIESYLTLPASGHNSKPPMIVIPHGGPINVRASRDYNATVQYLASLGYAVLRPNFRGSAGFGKQFKEAGKQQWGKLIEDDIDSATEKVIQENLVDKDRICIYGASYGGYSALISGIRRPDLYKCSASFIGVSDINLLLANRFEEMQDETLDWFKEYLGNPDNNQQELILNSPVYQAEKLKTPVFLAHGLKDSVVDIEHFYRMKRELDKHGNSATTLILKDEEHGLKYLNSYVELYSALDSFFRKHLKLGPAEVLRK